MYGAKAHKDRSLSRGIGQDGGGSVLGSLVVVDLYTEVNICDTFAHIVPYLKVPMGSCTTSVHDSLFGWMSVDRRTSQNKDAYLGYVHGRIGESSLWKSAVMSDTLARSVYINVHT